MAPKWIGLWFFIWVLAILLGSISEGTNLFAAVNVTESGQDVLQWQGARVGTSWGNLAFPAPSTSFFSNLFSMLTLNFPLFSGPWEIVRWIVIGPIVATIVFGLIGMFFNILRQNV